MKGKIDWWRIILGSISILAIIFMWARKDIVHIYSTMPSDQIAPLIITTILVTILKVGAIAGTVFLIGFIVNKIKNRHVKPTTIDDKIEDVASEENNIENNN